MVFYNRVVLNAFFFVVVKSRRRWKNEERRKIMILMMMNIVVGDLVQAVHMEQRVIVANVPENEVA